MKQESDIKKKFIITRPILLGLLIGLGILSISVLLWYYPEIAESMGIILFRGWIKTPCENVSSPRCGGVCPEGEICVALSENGFCYCIEKVEDSGCSDSYPKCDAGCPDGYVCQTKDNIFDPMCYCERVPCQSSKPGCTGYCDEGTCTYNEQEERCICKSEAEPTEEEGGEEGEEGEFTPCADTYPACGGFCNPGYACASGTVNGTCECQEITTAYCSGSYPLCSGDCGEGRSCVLSGEECKCVSQSSPTPGGAACGDSEWPYCGGACPEGMTCIDNEETAACVEDIFCYCDHV